MYEQSLREPIYLGLLRELLPLRSVSWFLKTLQKRQVFLSVVNRQTRFLEADYTMLSTSSNLSGLVTVLNIFTQFGQRYHYQTAFELWTLKRHGMTPNKCWDQLLGNHKYLNVYSDTVGQSAEETIAITDYNNKIYNL